MKLYINSASPYARLVRIVSIETGLSNHIRYVEVDPWDDYSSLSKVNPAAKIPALVCADGRVLIESEIICDYLIHHAGKRRMLPEEQADKVERLQLLGLGRAAMDCAFGVVIQARFGMPKSVLAQRWTQSIPFIAKELERLFTPFSSLPSRPDLADITVAVAFQYTSFRLPALNWAEHASGLSKWVEGMGGLESFVATRPR